MIYNNELQNSNNKLQSILETINTLPEAGSGEGVELPELSNEGQASDLLVGKELIDSEGNIVTGSMPNNGVISAIFNGLDTKSYTIPVGYTSGGTVSLDNTIDNEVSEQADLISQIKSVVDSLPDAENGGASSGGSSDIKTCTLTISGPFAFAYNEVVDGNIVAQYNQITNISNIIVPCSSLVVVTDYLILGGITAPETAQNVTIVHDGTEYYEPTSIFQVSSVANSHCILSFGN